MGERIDKLQPNRTLALRGFDDLGAAAALHSATADSFKVSGVFRDPADFAVLILHDADNFYEHPRLKYLPDHDFSGLTLRFDVRYSGLMPLDSPKYPTIDWPYLDVIRQDGTTASISLFANAQQAGGTYTPATAEFQVQDNGLEEYDRLTLWYLNYAFDYVVPKVECAYAFTPGGAGTVHGITVGATPYVYVELAGDSGAVIAQALAALIGPSPLVSAAATFDQIDIRATQDNGGSIEITSTAGAGYTLHQIGKQAVAAALAAQINTCDWTAVGMAMAISATAESGRVRLTCSRPGADGNMRTMYAVSRNSRLRTGSSTASFTGGSSDATWRITLDFSALGIDRVRMMWLTFAPALANSAAFASTEWEAVYTNWTLLGDETKKALSVAGPGSVRIEENDAWCSYTGNWGLETGFYSNGFARRAAALNDSVTVRYSCGFTHHLYIGTSLYTDRGTVGVRLNGDAETDLNCYLPNEPGVNTRRLVRAAVPRGEHSVIIRLKSPGYFYFDFLEAAVPSDVPDAPPGRTDLSPALDYSTDHTYKLSPARLMWMFDKLGFLGPMNEYLGVFWWNQRIISGAVYPSATVTFNGAFAAGDQIFVEIGGLVAGKSVFPNETNDILANHFACLINATYVGVWAQAVGNVLTIVARSPKPAYSYSFSAWKDPSSSSGSIAASGSLEGGIAGKWVIDPSVAMPLNRAAQDWHRDLFAECQSRGREIVIAESMELVNPPAGFAAIYPDGQPVITDMGFGNLKSTHCAFVSAMLEYQKKVYTAVAGLMVNAGLTPNLQFGEFLWWFFTNKSQTNPGGGMAFHHPDVTAAAQTQFGRPLHIFRDPDDDPTVNGGADAIFLRNILRDHVAGLIAHVKAQHPQAKFELLFPYDVNYPSPAGIHHLGGRLNRFVNFPAEWESKAGSGLDRIKMEALDFGAWSRNLDLADQAIRFPLELGWPKDSVRHLVPIFRCGYPWEKEVDMAAGRGVPVINLWAFDHVCLFNLPVTKQTQGRAWQI